MNKLIIRFLAIIAMIPIMIIGIGISIIWNGYLIGKYVSIRVKRRWNAYKNRLK